MKIDYISDLHVNHYIDDVKHIPDYVKSILPPVIGDVLIIAGDISDTNELATELLKYLGTIYKNVLFVFGNHDMYLFNRDQYKTSFERMVDILNNLPENVIHLNGQIIDIDGIKFGGCNGWYDGEYAKKLFPYTDEQVNYIWTRSMADASYIYENSNDDIFNWKQHFNHQYELMKSIADKIDIMVTHVSPCMERIDEKYMEFPSTGFFYFDGRKLMEKMDNKMWIHGHIHSKKDYVNAYGVNILCNPLAYPSEVQEGFGIKYFYR